MALVKCGECGNKISDKAAACPNCGAPPAVRAAVAVATKKTSHYKVWLIVLAIVFGGGFIASAVSNWGAERQTQDEARERQVRRDAYYLAQKKKLDAFTSNPTPTLAQAQNLGTQGKWMAVKDLLAPYLATNNVDVKRLHDDATEKQLLLRVATIPATDAKANYEQYAELAKLRPENKTYAAKRDSYKSRADEKEAKELAEKLVFGDAPVKSPWDGSYPVVETYLQRVANDPDSIDMVGCTDVFKNKDGWLVGCQYRGKNAFGGTILTANWFRIQRGQVVEVYDHDKFKCSSSDLI